MLIASGFGRGTSYRLNRGDVASSDVASSRATHSDEETVITMIREVCRHKWLSAKEISLKIGRHPTHIRRVIKKMLDKGELKQEFPNQPTHPAQRYHTV